MLHHILDFLASPWTQTAGFGLFLFGYTWVTKVDNVDYAAAMHVNTLQTEKADRDGQVPMTGVVQWKKGADVASAMALPLGNDGNYFDVTGTTIITSIVQTAVGGAAVQAGTIVKLHFDGALILAHHATDLILPGAANITTVAGMELEFINYAAGDWRCMTLPYSTGTCTLGFAFGGGTTGMTYNDAFILGRYVRIGQLVMVSGYLVLTNKGSSVGVATVTGLPFAVLAGGGPSYTAATVAMNYITFANQGIAYVFPGTTVISLQEITEAGIATELTDANFANNSAVRISCSYIAA